MADGIQVAAAQLLRCFLTLQLQFPRPKRLLQPAKARTRASTAVFRKKPRPNGRFVPDHQRKLRGPPAGGRTHARALRRGRDFAPRALLRRTGGCALAEKRGHDRGRVSTSPLAPPSSRRAPLCAQRPAPSEARFALPAGSAASRPVASRPAAAAPFGSILATPSRGVGSGVRSS